MPNPMIATLRAVRNLRLTSGLQQIPPDCGRQNQHTAGHKHAGKHTGTPPVQSLALIQRSVDQAQSAAHVQKAPPIRALRLPAGRHSEIEAEHRDRHENSTRPEDPMHER